MIFLYTSIVNPDLYSLEERKHISWDDLQNEEYWHSALGMLTVLLALYFIVVESLKIRKGKNKLGICQLCYHAFVVVTYFMDYLDYVNADGDDNEYF